MSDYDSADPSGQARLQLMEVVRRVTSLDPAATALTFGDESFQWSYLGDAIADLDALLGTHASARRVGIVLRNRPGSVAALVATIGTGRQAVTLSPHLGDIGLSEDIIDLSPDIIVADDEDWARPAVRDAAARIGAVAIRVGSSPRALSAYSATWEATPTLEPAGDIAVLMMTSGTTGKPKRVELTYDRMVAAFRAAGTPVDTSHESQLRKRAAILWASMAHISGLYFAIAHVLEGRSIALLERFDVMAWAELVRLHQPGYVRLPPAAMRMVLGADLPLDTFSSVRAVGTGTAPLPPELAEAFEEKYGTPVLGTYGATEFAGAIAGWSLKDKKVWGAAKRGSAGRAHHGIELRVVDRDTDVVLPVGQVGLLEARGGQLPGDADAWVRTTDLARLDEDGFLFIHGRADDAINRGGFKIPPSVIEDALHDHPSVDEAAAIGIPDERLGEVPVVAVTTSGDVTEDELSDFLAQKLTSYQRPVAVRIVDALPRTPSMKVSRPLVREQFFAGEELAPS